MGKVEMVENVLGFLGSRGGGPIEGPHTSCHFGDRIMFVGEVGV